ncbi:Saccharopine dehydrogenase [Candidatus Competibacter denitrificans Run_A_D11]|uniref:Saccharopine dehydrogenase n=1 Tax=Candidatus Competibacter denitrificans Run_A_D11 TaxID=1400863 RepID=W6MAV1_9GAMM|nr:saccharopine dehydrogenase family protein [Candidatus Competibacter denitrificans]CDI03100.1 Saccharopine dehydrogenase [Candidatus Competibacter denitrificans Run_A_D11]HAS87672.1 saccharopine dehydrogenase family protein [Candidatus Competibacteraceae bacterium]HRC68769.1 saccharopine dehydrogenase family protein [Candidatus Competibacter denitrificans]
MKKNVLIIGAGGVAHVAAHKAAMNNALLGDICIASRTLAKCDGIIESVKRKGHIQNPAYKLYSRQIDALDIPATVKLIKETNSQIVINLGQAFLNMSILEACLETGVAYIDTAIHEEPDKVCENPPWYANYEWKRKERCAEKGLTAILGAGFDPGVVNAYCALAVKRYFDKIDTIDILDVNAGSHGKYFATNFDPEINFREFIKVWTWIDRQWKEYPTHSVKRVYDFPVVGSCPIYLNGHDELHSLSKNIDANSIRFWMGFGDHYINVFTVLRTLGFLSHLPVTLSTGQEVVPLKVVKALLPDPQTLAPGYTGKTCIGNFVKGWKNGKAREVFIYQVSDHKQCYEEVESQGISYTAGVPPVAAAMLVAQGDWDAKTMVNVEELDPEPFIAILDKIGLPTDIKEIEPGSQASFNGTVRDLETELAESTAMVTVSAANPMIAVMRKPAAKAG